MRRRKDVLYTSKAATVYPLNCSIHHPTLIAGFEEFERTRRFRGRQLSVGQSGCHEPGLALQHHQIMVQEPVKTLFHAIVYLMNSVLRYILTLL